MYKKISCNLVNVYIKETILLHVGLFTIRIKIDPNRKIEPNQ